MKIIRRSFIVILVFSFFGCATIKYDVPTNIENLSDPELNVITMRNIGDILIKQAISYNTDSIIVLSDFDGGLVKKGIYKRIGSQIIYGRNSDKNDIKIIFEPVKATGANIQPSLWTGPTIKYYLTIEDDQLYRSFENGVGVIACLEVIPLQYYSHEPFTIEDPNNFQQTLIYTGKEKNILKFTYQEFKDNFIRSSFSVDVTYDLDESNIIAFKNAKLEIIEATNTSITYKLLNNF